MPLWYDDVDTQQRPNFVVGSDGVEYYLERLYYTGDPWNTERILHYLDAQQAHPNVQSSVMRSIARVQSLGVDTNPNLAVFTPIWSPNLAHTPVL